MGLTLRYFQTQSGALEAEVLAYLKNSRMAIRGLTAHTLETMPYLIEGLVHIVVDISKTEIPAEPHPYGAGSSGVGGVGPECGGGTGVAVVVGTPTGSDKLVQQHAVAVVTGKGVDDLARQIARMLS